MFHARGGAVTLLTLAKCSPTLEGVYCRSPLPLSLCSSPVWDTAAMNSCSLCFQIISLLSVNLSVFLFSAE